MSIPFLNAFEAPRLTDGERDTLLMPGTGALIFNTTDKMLQVNVGTPEVPDWQAVGIGTSGLIVEGEVPTSPYPGQYMVYMDSRVNPKYKWQMIYNPERTDGYKWDCIGGDPWIVWNLGGAYGLPRGWHKMVPAPANELIVFRSGKYLIECGFGTSWQSADSYYNFENQFTRVSPGGAGVAVGAMYCEAGIPGSGDNSSVTVETDHAGGASVSGVFDLVPGWLSLYEFRNYASSPPAIAWMKVIPKAFA